MRRIGLIAMVLPVLAPATASAQDAGAAARRSCGTVTSTSVYKYARVVAIRGVSCRNARRVVARYDSRGTTYRGWRCALAHDDRPRLFSCGAGAGSGDLRNRARAVEAIGTNRAQEPRCATVSYSGQTYVLFYRGMQCSTARRRVRYVNANRGLPGWRCSSGSRFRSGGYCSRGRAYFGWHPGD